MQIRFGSYNFRCRCAWFYCVLQLSLRCSHWNNCEILFGGPACMLRQWFVSSSIFVLVFSLLSILFNWRQTCFFSSGIEMIAFGVTISTLVSAERSCYRISCAPSCKESSAIPPPAPLAIPFRVRERFFNCKSQWNAIGTNVPAPLATPFPMR